MADPSPESTIAEAHAAFADLVNPPTREWPTFYRDLVVARAALIFDPKTPPAEQPRTWEEAKGARR